MSSFQSQIGKWSNTLKFDLSKCNTYHRKYIVDKKILNELWELKLLGRRIYGLGYTSGGTNYTYTHGTSLAFIAAKDVKAKISKQREKHQGIGLAIYVPTSKSTTSTSKPTPQSLFMKVIYVDNIKVSSSIAIVRIKLNLQ